ncbi:BTAD domain-containing putative transcriptional regulator [Nonomuraea sp. NPDC049309]|uniref:AfsR/SARP family transcriptional regulator n=1 Tax=Nonomuraea sp. NPDC049309 TaxID=3364350 RepID=UPI0037186145
MALADGDAGRAAALLCEGLELWRGAPLADGPHATAAAAALEELRLTATEDRIQADLALGRHRELVAELTSLTAAHPLRERLRAQLMRARYGSCRQAEALAVYADARKLLDEELGSHPAPNSPPPTWPSSAPTRHSRRHPTRRPPPLPPLPRHPVPLRARPVRRLEAAGRRRAVGQRAAGVTRPDHQLRRPCRRTAPGRREPAERPAAHAGRPRRGGQDPPCDRGGGAGDRRDVLRPPRPRLRRRLTGRAGGPGHPRRRDAAAGVAEPAGGWDRPAERGAVVRRRRRRSPAG